MAFYYSTKPVYDTNLDKAINMLIYNAVDIISICRYARYPITHDFFGRVWYSYREDFRRISDALTLVEHDAFLLMDRISKVSQALFGAYYEENPDAAGNDNAQLSLAELAAMREEYFRYEVW